MHFDGIKAVKHSPSMNFTQKPQGLVGLVTDIFSNRFMKSEFTIFMGHFNKGDDGYIASGWNYHLTTDEDTA